jgi:hypothetical protein
MELHGHEEAIDREKGETMLGITTEKEQRKVQCRRQWQAGTELRQEWQYSPDQVVMVGMVQHSWQKHWPWGMARTTVAVKVQAMGNSNH